MAAGDNHHGDYVTLEQAYDWFNGRLFGGVLPPCLLTLQRHGRSRGYFANDRFQHRADGQQTRHELALNPDLFVGRSDKDILSTLVHEMVHCWQQCLGSPSQRGYHNREWATKMIEVGLMPSSTGQEGGAQTGQSITHYVIAGDPFDGLADELLRTGLRLQWQSLPLTAEAEQKRRSKTKYTCPACGLNAWAKPAAPLVCGACGCQMEMGE